MKKEKIFKKLAAFALSGIMLFSSVSVIACNDGDDDSSEVVKSDTETQKSEDDSGKKDQSEKKDEQNQSGEVSNALELTKAFIIGDITSGNWVELKLADDKKSASYTFTYDGSAMTKWGGGNGTGSFKFSEFGDWNNPSYGGEGAEIFVSPDTALLEVTSGTSRKNIKCTEFITENEYTITLWKTGEGSCKIKLVTSKMVHEPEVIVEKPNEFKFNTFAASDSSVISFSDKKLTLVDNSGNAVSYEYEIGDAGSKASVKNGDSKVSIELSDGKFKFGGKDYSLSEDKLVAGGKVYSITASDRAKCYIEDRENETIIFIFDYANWGQTQEVKTAYVRGSFTSWKDKDAFAMSYAKNLSLNYVSVSKREVVTIGNSGHPEYKFYINNSYMGTEGVSFVPEGYIFHTSDENLIVVYSDENLEEIIAESNIAGKVKALADFDITTRAGKEEVSNFRLVPGTTKLFRSFHPYYSTGGRSEKYETEKTRLALVQALAVEEGIKSDINLTDDYTTKVGEELKWYDGTTSTVTIPAYYQAIIDSESVCNVKTAEGTVPSYDYVYNKPRDPKFSEWVQVIVDFVIDDAHAAPFEIHCAIGTDRTGVFSALLGAFCGATWEQVAEDYQKTNRMCINEYRSKALLAQSFQRLLDVNDVSKVENLQKSLWDYFTTTTLNNQPILTKEKLEKLCEKLGGTVLR